jgi:hypothetical protein
MKILSFAVAAFLAVSVITLDASAQNNRTTGIFGAATIAFGQESFDFSTQGIGIPNCINIPIGNKTDQVQILKEIRSNLGVFTISSPAEEMLPIEIQPGGALYVAVCFRPTEAKAYTGKITAVFGSDSSVLAVSGGGIHVEKIKIPTKEDLRVVPAKGTGHDFTFEVDLPRSMVIDLQVTDELGNIVKGNFTYGEIKQPGPYKFSFNCRDQQGNALPNGKYYVKFSTIDFRTTKSFVINVPRKKQKK